MPVQRTLWGHPIAIRMPPRRFQVVFFLAVVLLSGIFLVSRTDSAPTPPVVVASIASTAQQAAVLFTHEKIPKLWNPFAQAVHDPPPEQPNSTLAGSSWFSDYKWLHPFSSSVTLDENRAVLPLRLPRTTIYTFYDSKGTRSKAILDAEHDLLLTWRRAWWAKGFRPVVLGRPEAMRNPLYEQTRKVSLTPEMELEVNRWLAWGHMKGGILANWLTLPMGPYNDPMLSSLRRGEIGELTRYDSLRDCLFVGIKEDINAAIEKMLGAIKIATATSPIQVLPTKSWKVDSHHSALACYDLKTVVSEYKSIAKEITESEASGLSSLNQMINSHLQSTWQEEFHAGLQIIQHLPRHGNVVIEPSVDIARNLSQCLDSPIPASCPPNRSRCKPCQKTVPFPINLVQSFHNESNTFTVGVVPHPYTTASLHYFKEDLQPRFVRRNTTRDDWLVTISKNIRSIVKDNRAHLSGPQLLTHFKEVVADEHEISRSLWLTPEKPNDEELDWIFGFAVPRNVTDTPRPDVPEAVGEVASKEELIREQEIYEAAKVVIKGGSKDAKATRSMVEAWNLADAEAWRFVTAFNARRRMERLKWEEEERAFAGAERRVEGWGGWFDRKTTWFHRDDA